MIFNIPNYEKLQEIKPKFEKLLEKYHINCICGHRLDSSDLAFFKFPKSDEYWLYTHCPNCQYDLNYQKIYRQYKMKEGTDKRFNTSRIEQENSNNDERI